MRRAPEWALMEEATDAAVAGAGAFLVPRGLAVKALAEFSDAEARAFVEAIVRAYLDGQQPIIFGRQA